MSLHRAGFPWTAKDEGLLLWAFEEGRSLAEVAAICGRTEAAVVTRLIRHDRLVRSPRTGLLHKIDPAPWI